MTVQYAKLSLLLLELSFLHCSKSVLLLYLQGLLSYLLLLCNSSTNKPNNLRCIVFVLFGQILLVINGAQREFVMRLTFSADNLARDQQHLIQDTIQDVPANFRFEKAASLEKKQTQTILFQVIMVFIDNCMFECVYLSCPLCVV